MKYLLDSNIAINHLRGKYNIVKAVNSTGLACSIITYGELLHGAYKSVDPQRGLHSISIFLHDLSVKIVPLDEKTIDHFAKLKASLELKGEKLADFDLLIAATALSHSLTLITNNIRHFHRVPGLRIEPIPYS